MLSSGLHRQVWTHIYVYTTHTDMHMLRCTLTHNNINSGVKQTQVDPQYSVSLDFSFMHKEYSCPRPHPVTVWKSNAAGAGFGTSRERSKVLGVLLPVVWVSYCCCSKYHKFGGLKTAQIHQLTDMGFRSVQWFQLAILKLSWQGYAPHQGFRETPLICFFGGHLNSLVCVLISLHLQNNDTGA